MTLTDRVTATDWNDTDRNWFAAVVVEALADAATRDLLFAVVARVIGDDEADLLTLRQRAREIVDLAQAMPAERQAMQAEVPRVRTAAPALRLVGGRDA